MKSRLLFFLGLFLVFLGGLFANLGVLLERCTQGAIDGIVTNLILYAVLLVMGWGLMLPALRERRAGYFNLIALAPVSICQMFGMVIAGNLLYRVNFRGFAPCDDWGTTGLELFPPSVVWVGPSLLLLHLVPLAAEVFFTVRSFSEEPATRPL